MSDDKGELLRKFLEERGVHVPYGMGWRKVRCINTEAHSHGDRNPSASVNLSTGYYRCFACDLAGDAIDLLQTLESLTYKQASTILRGAQSPRVEEPTWI